MFWANWVQGVNGFVLCNAMPETPRDQLPFNLIIPCIHPLPSLPLIPAEHASTPFFAHCTVIHGASIYLKWFSDGKRVGWGWGAEGICDFWFVIIKHGFFFFSCSLKYVSNTAFLRYIPSFTEKFVLVWKLESLQGVSLPPECLAVV